MPVRLDDDSVRAILIALDAGVPVGKVAEIADVSRSTISSIRNGHSWTKVTAKGGVPPTPPKRRRAISRLPDETAAAVRALRSLKWTPAAIAEALHLPREKVIATIQRRR